METELFLHIPYRKTFAEIVFRKGFNQVILVGGHPRGIVIACNVWRDSLPPNQYSQGGILQTALGFLFINLCFLHHYPAMQMTPFYLSPFISWLIEYQVFIYLFTLLFTFPLPFSFSSPYIYQCLNHSVQYPSCVFPITYIPLSPFLRHPSLIPCLVQLSLVN